MTTNWERRVKCLRACLIPSRGVDGGTLVQCRRVAYWMRHAIGSGRMRMEVSHPFVTPSPHRLRGCMHPHLSRMWTRVSNRMDATDGRANWAQMRLVGPVSSQAVLQDLTGLSTRQLLDWCLVQDTSSGLHQSFLCLYFLRLLLLTSLYTLLSLLAADAATDAAADAATLVATYCVGKRLAWVRFP